MADFRLLGAERGTSIRFDPSPVHNALCSVCLLNQPHLDHISPWVDRTVATLPSEIRKAAERACGAVRFFDGGRYGDLGEWIDAFAAMDPTRIARIDAERTVALAARLLADTAPPSVSELLTDRDAYIEIESRLHAVHEKEADRAELERTWDDLHSGATYRDGIVVTLRYLWDNHLRDEWAALRPAVEDSVRAFSSVSFGAPTTVERLKLITERDYLPEEWIAVVETAREVVFVPSAHIGPYMILFDFDGATAWIVGHARVPAGATVRSPVLERSDLLIRLEALGDETRLRILEIAARDGETTTQAILDELGLSQSSASRHLTQLGATGILAVDSSERTKRYRINESRIQDVCRAITAMTVRGSTGHR